MNSLARQWPSYVVGLLLIVAGIAAGLVMPVPQQPWSPAAEGAISYGLSELWLIASRNLWIGLQLVIGAVSLGIYSLIQLFGLGFSLGWTISAATHNAVPPSHIVLLLAPHGIIEFAGFLVLAAIEFEAAKLAYRKLRYGQMTLDKPFLLSLAKQALLGVALIGVAAIVEVYLTGPIAASLYPTTGG
jgi:uncharacterized membrane protein SpoIIM required for sporulation